MVYVIIEPMTKMTEEENRQIEEYYKSNKVEFVPSKDVGDGNLWIAKTLEKSASMEWKEDSPWRHNAVKALEDEKY